MGIYSITSCILLYTRTHAHTHTHNLNKTSHLLYSANWWDNLIYNRVIVSSWWEKYARDLNCPEKHECLC